VAGWDYLPIAAYGAIGNLRTIALVGLNGSIDWCCLPELDSPSVFAGLLDARLGGRFQVRAVGSEGAVGVLPAPGAATQRYLPDTNVLVTESRAGGLLRLTDWMPLSGNIEGVGGSVAEPEVLRLLEALEAEVEVELVWAPRLDYARAATTVAEVGEGIFLATEGAAAPVAGARLALEGLPPRGDPRLGALELRDEEGPTLRARLRLRPGDRLCLRTRYGEPLGAGHALAEALAGLEETCRTWRDWVHKEQATGSRAWAGAWNDAVIRSELALKLMVYADSGAIAAAGTTSLPEEIGGVRNWDYRFAWIRDAGRTAQVLFGMGHERDAIDFLQWAEHAAHDAEVGQHRLQLMYGLRGETELPEQVLSHLEGYRGSAPVHLGNGAATQLQLDIYGELLEAAYVLHRQGVVLEPEIARFVATVADDACGRWHEPDYGIWEVRLDPSHFVYSKVMCWTALDRALVLARRGAIHADAATTARWRASRDEIRRTVLERGADPVTGAFTMAFDRPETDAANLLIPLVEFVPFDDPRTRATIDAVLRDLTEDGLVYRYRFDDGIPGGEGAFGLCTFWLVYALALSGRIDEAWAIYEGIMGRANHLGLLSEQIDPRTGELLGNFPQAYSHIGVINGSLYLAYAEGKELPVPPPIGTPEHRRDKEQG
jgi:GH15 family glucan-1,4-alpha-glucosidase